MPASGTTPAVLVPVREDRAELMRQFAQRCPWRADDYPDLPKRLAPRTFWSAVYGPLTLHGALSGGSVAIVAFDRTRSGRTEHSWVQIGPGGLCYATKDSMGYPLKAPGYYLVKYGNQVRGHYPLPGLTEKMALDICRRTGLTPGFELQRRHGARPDRSFFATEAGLAFAKWFAAHPRRAREFSVDYGDLVEGAQTRMRLELARVALSS
jgi:hypothetical protein